MMLKYFISQAINGPGLIKQGFGRDTAGHNPGGKRAVLEAASQAGAKEAYLIEEPVAAAIGAGLPVTEAGAV